LRISANFFCADFARHRNIAGNRRKRKRKNRAQIFAFVVGACLCDGETQLALAIDLLDEEEAACVGVGEFSRLAHDQPLELGNVALGPQRKTDVEQLLRFAIGAVPGIRNAPELRRIAKIVPAARSAVSNARGRSVR